MSSGFITVNSDPVLKLFYKADGPLTGRPVIVLVNSLASSTLLWEAFVAEFKKDYTIIRYDQRFHGQSPLVSGYNYEAGGFTIEDLARDIIVILDNLKIERVRAVIGLSIGAATALVLGALFPKRVEHVLVVGTFAKSSELVKEAFDTRIEVGRTQGMQNLGEQSVRRWFLPEWVSEHQETVRFLGAVVGSQSLEGYIATVRALQSLDLWPYISIIKKTNDGLRFKFIAGETDVPIPEATQALGNSAGSEVIIIKDCGHIIPIQKPQTFYKIVRDTI